MVLGSSHYHQRAHVKPVQLQSTQHAYDTNPWHVGGLRDPAVTGTATGDGGTYSDSSAGTPCLHQRRYCCLPQQPGDTTMNSTGKNHKLNTTTAGGGVGGYYDNNVPQSAASMVASYGVYQDVDEDADGFTMRRGSGYHHHQQQPNHYHQQHHQQPMPVQVAGVTTTGGVLVVNSSGNSTVMRAGEHHPVAVHQMNNSQCGVGTGGGGGDGGDGRGTSCGWCLTAPAGDAGNTSQDTESCWSALCRPACLLFTLVLLVLVFMLVSGVLLYFNYEAYKPRHSFNEEPCEKTFCAWGAQCITAADGRALCQCPTQCRPHVDPVCGTDGSTYANHCQLRVASCPARLNTRVRHAGECEQNDPCRDKQCGVGARCVATSDGRNATCQCPDRCPRYGDHAAAGAVCGSNGADYASQCELRRAACTTATNITVKFLGKCDPCAGIECAEPEICQLDEHRNPVCRCGDTCPLEFTPVCGSDGKTYSNECTLLQETCKTRRSLNIIYRGKCSSGVNPCTSVRCTLGEQCTINKFGIAKCECPPACEPVMRPVCGTDGRTYASACELRRAACIARVAAAPVSYAGVCGERGPCTEHECQYGATCVVRAVTGTAHCECPVCPAEFRPVCGSDGISYGNECKLRLEACKHRREIRVLYEGPCNGCENKKCDFYSTCESDGSAAEGHCVCPQSCSDDKQEPVCGTDGVTYSNLCELHVVSCKSKQYVLVAYNGDCDLCLDKQCKYGARCEAGDCVCPTNCAGSGDEPVCSSNMITYANECELQKAACLQSTSGGVRPLSLTVAFYGDCRERFPSAAAFPTGGVSTPHVPIITVPPIDGSNNPHRIASEPPSSNNNTPVSVIGTELAGVSPSVTAAVPATEAEACRDIHCDYEATCELGPDHFPRCTCQFDCANAASVGGTKPVCASDMRMYPSLCAMKMEACQRQEDLRLRPLDLCQGMELKPCNGEKPLTMPGSSMELDCGNGPHRQDCPSGSYCHQTTRFARCCQKDQSGVQQKSCEDGWYGCCSDGKTPAQGPEQAGCPATCGCNKLGSYEDTCDPETLQCRCRPGVGGSKCDRCEPGYWGLPKISSGHHGCIPCGCSTFGSVRDDCEQMTGRCVCKPGIQGQKCTVCTSHDKQLGPNGCVSDELSATAPRTCKELTCHFGAVCTETRGGGGGGGGGSGPVAICECHADCAEDTDTQIVCGSDGQTYACTCQLRLVACRLQKDIVVQAFGTCKEDMFTGTDWPIRQYTPQQFTQSDDSNSPLSKSTRHLLVPDSRYYYEKSNGASLSNNGGSVPAHRPALAGDLSNFVPAENILGVGLDNSLGHGHANNILSSRGGFATAYRPTPATVRVVTALLGDLCSDNADCVILYSACHMGACTCIPEYVESTDRQECLVADNSTDEYRACTSSPCHHESTCIDLPSATFTCVCASGTTGSLCTIALTDEDILPLPPVLNRFEIPAFDGQAHVRLKPLKAYHKLSLEIEFQTYGDDGLLLYDQQWPDGTGDFVSLALVAGFVEFRYNLGNGPVILKSLERVQYRRFHRVVVKRYHRDGMLKLDDGEDVAGKTGGSLRALDLNEDTYVGRIVSNHSRVYENIGTDRGFHGCIRRLKIGRRTVDLQPTVQHPVVVHHHQHDDWVLGAVGLRECGANPCAKIPCEAGGRCVALDDERYRCDCSVVEGGRTGERCEVSVDPCESGPCRMGATCEATSVGSAAMEYTCKCPPGLTGKTCSKLDPDVELSLPEFDGTAHLEFGRLEAVGRSFAIEIAFRPATGNGLLLYNGQLRDGRGDFVSLALVNGHVQFRYNLGSGIANITSKEPVQLDTWHFVRLFRKGREGILHVNNASVIRGYSGSPLAELNLELPFYVGSVQSWKEVHKFVGIAKGFKGAIQRLAVNGQPFAITGRLPVCGTAPLSHAAVVLANYSIGCSSHVTVYDGLPCPLARNPCQNGGLCIPDLNEYHCYCHSNFAGKYCEMARDDTPAVKFTGETFLHFKNRGFKSENSSGFHSDYANDDEEEEEEDKYDFEENADDFGDVLTYTNYDEDDEYDEYDSNFYYAMGRKGERGNRYELKIRTFLSDGLLLWRSKSSSLEQDYLSVAIVNGHPELSFNLGKQREFWAIRSKRKVDDGQWHTIQVRRRKRMGFIGVDGETPTKGIANSGAISLSTSDKLWMGGVVSLPSGLPTAYYKGFEGCIQHVNVNAKKLDLRQTGTSGRAVQLCHDNEI